MTDVQLDLLWWPPPDNEPLGQERAEELITLLRFAEPVVDAAEADLRQRTDPGAEIVRSRAPLIYFVNAHLDPEMTPLCVGTVYESSTGDPEQNSIQLRRDGRLTWCRE